MFDEPFTSAQANHHQPTDPSDLSARDTGTDSVEIVHRQLLALADEWAATLPSADRTVEYARGLVAGPRESPPEELARPGVDETTTSGRGHNAHGVRPAPRGPFTRARTLSAIAAMVAIVVVLVEVLHSVMPARQASGGTATPRPSVSTSTPLPSATPLPPMGPIGTTWTVRVDLSGNAAAPILAPSNPQIIYRDGARLERSSDGGKSWHTLATPQYTGAAVASTSIFAEVSTLDPDVLLISVNVQLSSTDGSLCPAGTSLLAATPSAAAADSPRNGFSTATLALAPLRWGATSNGFRSCAADFASRDGGASWTSLSLPAGVTQLPGASVLRGGLEGQDHRLYGNIDAGTTKSPLMGVRILTSEDGLTWQYADTPLHALGLNICDYGAAARGSTLYALTATQPCESAPLKTFQLWRSDDVGRHWQPESTLTARSARIAAVLSATGGNAAPIYVRLYPSLADASMRLAVSQDGGKSWQSAPDAGIPAGYAPLIPAQGTLADGSVVEAFSNTSVPQKQGGNLSLTFFAWKAGDASWRRVSAPLSLDWWSYPTFLVTANPQGAWNILWVINDMTPVNHFSSYTVYQFSI